LRPELDVRRFGDVEALEDGEVPIRESRPDTNVPPRIAKLLHRRIGIRNDLRECGAIQPLAGRSRTGVGLLTGNYVWSIRREARDLRRTTLIGDVSGIKDG